MDAGGPQGNDAALVGEEVGERRQPPAAHLQLATCPPFGPPPRLGVGWERRDCPLKSTSICTLTGGGSGPTKKSRQPAVQRVEVRRLVREQRQLECRSGAGEAGRGEAEEAFLF